MLQNNEVDQPYELYSNVDADRRWSSVVQAAAGATEVLSAGTASGLGALSVAPRLHSDFNARFLQVRSEKLAQFFGGEMRYIVPGGKLGRKYTNLLTDDLTDAARLLWDRRDEAAALVESSLAKVEYYRNVTDPRVLGVVDIGVSIGMARADPLQIILDLEVLGSGMVWTLDRIHKESLPALEAVLMERANRHSSFADLLCELRANRIRGRVEETARGVLRVAGMELEDALERLTRADTLKFDFRNYECQLYWKDRTLRCDVGTIEPGWSLRGGVLWLKARMPEVLSQGRGGRRLGEVVSNEFLPADAVISYSEARPDDQHVMWLQIPTFRSARPR